MSLDCGLGRLTYALLTPLMIAATSPAAAQQDARNSFVEASAGSIIFIETAHVLDDGREQPLRTGTGVVIDRQGLVLTSYHTFQPENSRLRVVARGSIASREGQRYSLTLLPVGNPQATDVAIAQFSPSLPTELWKPLRCGDSRLERDADPQWVIGFPLNLDRRVKSGSRSGCGFIAGTCETSAPVLAGFSGGPVLNNFGEIVGVLLGNLGNQAQMNVYRPVHMLRSMISDSGAGCFAEDAIAASARQVAPALAATLPSAAQEVAATAQRGGAAIPPGPFVVNGIHRADAPLLAQEEIVFRPGGRLLIPVPKDGSRAMVMAKRIIIEDPTTPAVITWDRPIEAGPGADIPGTGHAGANANREGENGQSGAPGAMGREGAEGRSAPSLALVVGDIRGGAGLVVDLVGQNGGRGGRGQAGGNGGDGAAGSPASLSAFDCRRGPGRGGDGGNGGAGGSGGDGGDGGAGGHLLFIDATGRPEVFERLIRTRLVGGAGGAPGGGGASGAYGLGGHEGADAPPWCRSAGRNGRDGAPGPEGQPGRPGAAGALGGVERLRLTQDQLGAFF